MPVISMVLFIPGVYVYHMYRVFSERLLEVEDLQK